MSCYYIERVTLVPPKAEGNEEPLEPIHIVGCRYPKNNWPARGSKTCPLEEGAACLFEGGPFDDIQLEGEIFARVPKIEKGE